MSKNAVGFIDDDGTNVVGTRRHFLKMLPAGGDGVDYRFLSGPVITAKANNLIKQDIIL